MINLKRGPWLGVIVGASLFFTFYAKRFVWIIVVLSAAVAVGVQPIYDRIASSYNHFTISGGRSTIWRIGAELATEYPLGVGYHNSGILRQFSTEIPRELKHFHNNLLNIVTENGWLAGLLFAWFLVEVCRASFRKPRDPIYIAIGCAVISWQIAGLVEYNFGDSEVMVIVWMLLGLLLQRESNAKPSRASEPASVSSPN
jgi:O-antigen ligase